MFSVTRAVINIKSVKYELVEPRYGHVRITAFQEHSSESRVSAVKDLKERNGAALKGLVLDLRNEPGDQLNTVAAVAGTFLKPNELVVHTEGRTEDSKTRLINAPGFLPTSRGVRLPQGPARLGQSRTLGGTRQLRGRLGLRDRDRRAAGPQAGHDRRDTGFRQGFSADRPAP